MSLSSLCLACVLAGLTVAKPLPADPFGAAAVVPADVTLYLHVDDPRGLRRELGARPIVGWLHALVEGGQFDKAWNALAQAARIDSGRLFDLCAGREFTVISRGGGIGADKSGERQWAFFSQLEGGARQLAQPLALLKAQVMQPRAGLSLYRLPEQEMLVALGADGHDVLVIGPSKAPALFFELLPRLSEPAAAASLSTDAALREAAELGRGDIGLFCRHAPPMGGWSLAVADVRGDKVALHHAARFDSAPFSHGVSQLTCDFSPVLSFGDRGGALVAMMQPNDIGDGPVEGFLAASLGQGLISPHMRANLASRRLLVIGEEEGRQLEHPVDLLSTTVATCLEVKDVEPAVAQLDQHMIKLRDAVASLCQGSMLDATGAGAGAAVAGVGGAPDVRFMRADQPRQVDLAGAANWFSGGFPIMKNISLNWTVARGPHGSWFVIASHPRCLNDVVEVLGDSKAAPAANPRFVGKFDSCGIGNGRRVERHLRSWSDAAEHFAEPDNVADFRDTLRLMSALAGGIRQCHWQLARPTANQMRLEMQIELVPAESARNE